MSAAGPCSSPSGRLHVVALTRSGLALARRVADHWPDAAIHCPQCVAGPCGQSSDPVDDPRLRPFTGPVRVRVEQLWAEGRTLVCVMALGIVVRLIGPLARDKRTDPAVVAVDEAGRFAISVLSGHAGAANRSCRRIAAAIGATPVITTASEVLGLPAVDLIGAAWGWRIEAESEANLTRVAAAVVNRRPVAVYQDAGRDDWWTEFGGWPETFRRVADLSTVPAEAAALLVISDRRWDDRITAWADRSVVYRPPSLVAGVGCRRGARVEEIDELVARVMDQFHLAPASLAEVATVSIKADEPALRQWASRRGLPLRAFPVDQLRAVPGVITPSPAVMAKIGLPGVCEPAALRAAGAAALLVPKQKASRVTVAIARILP